MAGLAWNLKAWWACRCRTARSPWRAQRQEKRRVLRMEFKTFLQAFLRLPARSSTAAGTNLSSAGLESFVGRVLPVGRPAARLSCVSRNRSLDAPVRRGARPQKAHHPMLIRQLDTPPPSPRRSPACLALTTSPINHATNQPDLERSGFFTRREVAMFLCMLKSALIIAFQCGTDSACQRFLLLGKGWSVSYLCRGLRCGSQCRHR